MSRGSRCKSKWQYEKDVPRCETCLNFQRPKTVLVNSLPRTSPPLCTLGPFCVKPTAVCNQWLGKKGETLE